MCVPSEGNKEALAEPAPGEGGEENNSAEMKGDNLLSAPKDLTSLAQTKAVNRLINSFMMFIYSWLYLS